MSEQFPFDVARRNAVRDFLRPVASRTEEDAYLFRLAQVIANNEVRATTDAVLDFGVPVDGGANAGPAIQSAMTTAMQTGSRLVFRSGVYTIAGTVQVTGQGRLEVACEPGVRFVGTAALGSNQRMFRFLNQNAAEDVRVFWRGGTLDGSAMPGQAPPGLNNNLLDINGEAIREFVVEDAFFFTGNDFSNSGGDSHVFLGECSGVTFRRCRFQGARDLAIYPSAAPAAARGSLLTVDDCRFYNCAFGVVPKRGWRGFTVVNSYFEQCAIGVATSEAETSGLTAEEMVVSNNRFFRCSRAIEARRQNAATITGNVILEIGHDNADLPIPTSAVGILLSGTRFATVQGNVVRGINPLATLTSSFQGIAIEARIFNAQTFFSTDNQVIGNTLVGLGRPVNETAGGQDRNEVLFNEAIDCLQPIAIAGASSRFIASQADGVSRAFSVAMGGAGNDGRVFTVTAPAVGDGRVGINTPTPARTLHIQADATPAAGVAGSGLLLARVNALATFTSAVNGISGLYLGQTGAEAQGGILYDNNADRLNLLANASVRLSVRANGTFLTVPGPFANDAAANTGGVAVGQCYRRTSDNVVVVRAV